MWRSVKDYFVSAEPGEDNNSEDTQSAPEPARDPQKRQLLALFEAAASSTLEEELRVEVVGPHRHKDALPPSNSAPIKRMCTMATSPSVGRSTAGSATTVGTMVSDEDGEDEKPIEDGSVSRKRKSLVSGTGRPRKRAKGALDKYARYLEENRKADDRVHGRQCDNCVRSGVLECASSAVRTRCHYCVMNKRGCTFDGRKKVWRVQRVVLSSEDVKQKEEKEQDVESEEGGDNEEEGGREEEDEGRKFADEDAPSPILSLRAPTRTNMSASAAQNPRRKTGHPAEMLTRSLQAPGVGLDGLEVSTRYTAVLDLENKTGSRRLQLVALQNQIAALEADIDVRCSQLFFLHDLAAALGEDKPQEVRG